MHSRTGIEGTCTTLLFPGSFRGLEKLLYVLVASTESTDILYGGRVSYPRSHSSVHLNLSRPSSKDLVWSCALNKNTTLVNVSRLASPIVEEKMVGDGARQIDQDGD